MSRAGSFAGQRGADTAGERKPAIKDQGRNRPLMIVLRVLVAVGLIVSVKYRVLWRFG
ncbi:hypothetical protein IWX63_003051 [Arthrobacter sp. CAN_A2]